MNFYFGESHRFRPPPPYKKEKKEMGKRGILCDSAKSYNRYDIIEEEKAADVFEKLL
jgi:hypothetical protein